MDSSDALRVGLPLAAFAVGVTALLWYWPWPAKVFLVNRERKKAEIIDIAELSADTKRFRLSLGSKNTILGLPVGKHIVLYCANSSKCLSTGKWNGRDDPDKGKVEIDRKYTPVTGNETPGYVDLVIKIYRPGKFPMPDGQEVHWEDGGKMGLHLDGLKVGDSLEVMGPLGVNEYLGEGIFKLPGKTVSVKTVGMMAGGTGLTPMLQVVQAAVRNPKDKTKFSLILANKTEADILCRDLLEDLAARFPDRFKLTYTLDIPPSNWAHKKGFITAEMIKECLPPPGPDNLVLMCGPPPMIEFACKKNLEALGFPKSAMVTF
mmetsp:Transcript_49622/g.105616  ORF Transcript_49622/g.105616 Transcript_49622/m.105616 type:complete len:319 (-) Transcript_49622:83-1039(-)|eukprot:CAMPEP_0206508088 /NCGR_PEP_ID=MMETSP0324_2-20121206/58069_1 /ASSEMBLY_ACC=CAM_ASM_000836 /TAXON_ID=2866 /ORGANISM="Crypthecodinium cohnii, Strain Seligo" /LENGTH=318 /DNA_ID=CAMNT_0053998775 /DNA_START=68 /DNA_END=1024 /DNA_ORIENTATION=+